MLDRSYFMRVDGTITQELLGAGLVGLTNENR